ncbi:MAG: hypothetical protein GTO45_01900 [Candidatus Aminicenantes bacterium]|nr:hypothetical protein [Candidatus Aminicenantes bacterium]NIM80325.1 hypothetical protein [Candidatus Aminicenantes bacterium]NIN16816.1 hypothetical protein [Candidatus Aminicenantes bacterium]NIN40672.1 hypothetical protein [Candidatus Aminicenantes bacterium]NIN83495.1 hypothetical protein [Candidatus Aminicenantes bacterium]
MEAKLTLKLDKNVIEEARKYARNSNISLSRLVERYFRLLTASKQENKIEKKYSPLVEELSGIIKIDIDFDFKKEYTDYLIEKYQ